MKEKYITFKKRLINFYAMIVGVIFIIVVPIEGFRPITELYRLIEMSRNLIAGLQAGFAESELERINRFSLDTMVHLHNANNLKIIERPYYSISFNMLLLEGKLLDEQQIKEKCDWGGLTYDHDKFKTAFAYWKLRLKNEPGLLEIFRKYKNTVTKAKENASSLAINELMIMLDIGKKDDIFIDRIVYVLNGASWSDTFGVYPGERCYISKSNEFWRSFALAGKTGFDHNPLFSPENWFFPKFDSDEWGTWLSVWLTTKTGNHFNLYNIDVEAAGVKHSLFLVASSVIVVMLLIFLLVMSFAQFFSGMITKPIEELSKGVIEVGKGNYNYVVPVFYKDEIGELTTHFNAMTKSQQERLNLLATLEKLLSKELAEKAAVNGLVLGGKRTECTIMFTDFAGFSTITQQMSGEKVVELLNLYFSDLISIIKQYGGFPDKYIGDAIVSIFGAPVATDNHAKRAVACAIAMQKHMREINEVRLRNGEMVFEMRIGLNSGIVIVGAIGCDMKLEYTAIGETTNMANRMESVCLIGHVMITQSTYDLIKNFVFKDVVISDNPSEVIVKGYNKPVKAYSILINDLTIEKNYKTEDIKNFYIYKQTSRNSL